MERKKEKTKMEMQKETESGKRIEAMNGVMADIHDCAVRHGWWDDERSGAECIALMHSELSEALESLRRGEPADDHCPEFSATVVELADCVIRIMDYCGRRGLPLADAILAKMKVNEGRPYKHGKKF